MSTVRRSGRMSTSRRVGAQSRARKTKPAASDRPVLLDEFRNDVTPRSLLMVGQEIGVSIAAPPGGKVHPLDVDGGMEESFDDVASVGGFSTGALSARSGGTDDDRGDDEDSRDPGARAARTSAPSAASAAAAEGDRWDRRRALVHDELSAPIALPPGVTGRPHLPSAAQAAQAGLLNELVDIVLTETETTTVLALPSLLVPGGALEEEVAAEAEAYAALGQNISKGGDAYANRHAQTSAPAKKNKGALARPPRTAEAGCQVTAWAMDEEARLEAEGEAWTDRAGGDLSASGAGAAVAGVAAAEQHIGTGLQGSFGGGGGAESLEAQVQGVVAASLTAPGATLEAEQAVVIGPALERGVELEGSRVPGTRRRMDARRLAVQVSVARGGGAFAGGEGDADEDEDGGGGAAGGGAGALVRPRGGGTGRKAGGGLGGTSGSGLQSSSQSLSESHPIASTTAGGAAKQAAAMAMAAAAAGSAVEGEAFDEAIRRDPNMMDAVTRKQAEAVIRGQESGRLLASMRAVERVLVQAKNHAAHRLYRAPAGSGQAAALVEELEKEAEAAAEAAAAVAAATAAAAEASSPGSGAAGLAVSGGGLGQRGEGDLDDEDEDEDEDEVAAGAAGAAAGASRPGVLASAAASAAGKGAAKEGGDARRVGFASAEDDADVADAEGLVELWSYAHDDITAAGLAVTAVAWSPATPSVLAVAYGPVRFATETRGCLCLWSMKNPSNPAVACWLPVGVTAISYSSSAPTLLAAGFYDGRVAVFDTKRLLDSARTGGKGNGGVRPDAMSDGLQAGCHSEPVWEVVWAERANRRGERLVSVSSDGRVNEWSTAKGLECHTIMQLKAARHGAAEAGASGGGDSAAAGGGAGGQGKAEALPAAAVERGAGRGMAETAGGQTQRAVSRGASGLCFAFMPPPLDVSKYLVGTEDGFLHTCSVSYAAQYLASKRVHDGPTNKVRLSPTDPMVCLTCGADWTVKMWVLGDEVALLKTYSATDSESAVVDVAWSQQLPTRFASVTEGGQIMVWEADEIMPVVQRSFTEEVTVPVELAAAVAAGGGGSAGAVSELLGGKLSSRAGAAAAASGAIADGDDEDEEDEEAAAISRARAAAAAAAAACRTVTRPRRFTCLAMAPTVPVLAAGDASGRVSVFRLIGSPEPPATAAEAHHQLEARIFGEEEEEEER